MENIWLWCMVCLEEAAIRKAIIRRYAGEILISTPFLTPVAFVFFQCRFRTGRTLRQDEPRHTGRRPQW